MSAKREFFTDAPMGFRQITGVAAVRQALREGTLRVRKDGTWQQRSKPAPTK